jgi:ATP-dependent Clp protease ATP-binding subunit ClpB
MILMPGAICKRRSTPHSSRQPGSRTITSAPNICCSACSTSGGPSLKKIFAAHGLKRDAVLKALAELRGNQRVTDQNPEDKFQALEKYGRDLTALARQGKIDPVIGRDEEIRRVMQVLTRRTKNNPVLIGEPGVGKTAIAEGLARRIVSGDVPESLKNKRLVAMDLSAMIAGAKYRGEFEDRLKAFLKEITRAKAKLSCSLTNCTRWSARARRKVRATRRTS